MLWEHNSTIVVMLTKLREMGRVRVLLWGEGGCGAVVCGHEPLAHPHLCSAPATLGEPPHWHVWWLTLWPHNHIGSQGVGGRSSSLSVLMSYPAPHPQEKCHQYWPAERSARYQYFVVDPMAEYNMPQYILREFKVTDARVSASAGSPAPLPLMPLPCPGQPREHATAPGEMGKQVLPCTAGRKGCCPPPTAHLTTGSCPASCASPMSSSGIPVSTRPCLACAAHSGKHLIQVPLHLESVCAASHRP